MLNGAGFGPSPRESERPCARWFLPTAKTDPLLSYSSFALLIFPDCFSKSFGPVKNPCKTDGL